MAQVQAHAFGYAHSQAVMEGLIAHTKGKALCIRSDYAYVEKPGETVMFQAMLEVAKQGGDDILYVDTVKEFAGFSLSEFKKNLTAIKKAGMTVQSLCEKNYNYDDFQTVIQVLEDLTPGYRKNYQQGLAAKLYELGIGIQDICEQTDLRESDVFQAIAECKREQEKRREREQEE